MLLNVESLQKLARDSSYSTSLEGNLLLRKNNMSAEKMHKRFCILKGNLLFYFNKKTDKLPIGLIVVEGYTVEMSSDVDGFCFQLIRRNSVTSDTRNGGYTFSADDADSLEQWMTALTTCSFEQMKIAVEGLSEQAENLLPDEFEKNKEAEMESLPIKRKSKTFAELHEQYGKKIDELHKRVSTPEEGKTPHNST